MDQLAIDVTDIPGIQTGTIVTLIGKDGNSEITSAQMAAKAGTITNELLSRLGQRLSVIVTYTTSLAGGRILRLLIRIYCLLTSFKNCSHASSWVTK